LLTPVLLLALSFAVLSRTTASAQQEPETEIKLFVAEGEIDQTRKRVAKEFAKGAPKRHQIYFFDTSALELYANTSGPVILRARQKGEEPQSTVKFRRAARDPELEKKLTEISSKLEIQREVILGKKGPAGISYALDAKWEKPLSQLAGADSKTIAEWFTPKQKKFLEAGGVKVDWEKLRVFGRIDADVWKWQVNDKRVDAEVTAEFWRLGVTQIFELSRKTLDKKWEKHVENFEVYFKEQNILAAENPESKTKQALDYFARATTKSAQATSLALCAQGAH